MIRRESRFCYICKSFHPSPLSCESAEWNQDQTGGKPTEVILGHGMIDLGPITYNGRTGLLLRKRDHHIPVGQPGEVQGEYWPRSGDVVIWFDNGDRGDTLLEAIMEVRQTMMGAQTDEV